MRWRAISAPSSSVCTDWYVYHSVQQRARVLARMSPASTQMSARERLLAGAMGHVARHGVGDLSLRGLAAALGTSHRMLIYHFGSREGLLIEVIRTVEAQQRAALAEMLLDEEAPPEETMRRMWRRVADPALWPNERLFFEVYAQALQGRSHAEPLLDGIVDLWVEPLARIAVARGEDEARARTEVRLGIAVTRGLLLDLLATRDRAAGGAAMGGYIGAPAPEPQNEGAGPSAPAPAPRQGPPA